MKILKIVLTIAAIVVNFIPGLGQLASAALFAAVGLLQLVMKPSGPKPETAESSIRQPIPPRVSCFGARKLYGAQILFDTAANGTAVDVWAFHDGRMDTILKYFLGDDPVDVSSTVVQTGADGRYKNGAVNIHTTTGVNPGTAISAIVTLMPGVWTSNHRGDGVVIGAVTWKSVKAADFQETYPASGPQSLALAAKWLRVYDWRLDSTNGGSGSHRPTTESTWAWSENPVLHLAHYLRKHQYNMGWTGIFTPHLASWTAAANDCDTTVALKAGGTEKRYRGCVAYRWNDPRKDVIGNLLGCFDGMLIEMSDGNPKVFSGRYYTPTVTIGPDEIVSYSWDYGVPDEDLTNEIAISYVSEDHDWSTVQGQSWRDEADITARGRVNSTTLEAQVPSHGQARRLAKRGMYRTNAKNRGTVAVNALGRTVRGERFIWLTLEEAGATFYDGPVELSQVIRNPETGGMTFNWIEASSAVDAWTAASEEGTAPAPVVASGAGGLVAPEITAIGVDFGKNGNGRLTIDIDAPDQDDLTWFARWKVTGDTDYGPANEYKDKAGGAAVQLRTELILLDESLDVQVKYKVGDGRESEWSDVYTLDSTTDNAQPEKPKNVGSDKSGSDVTVKWKNPPAYADYVKVFRGTSNVFGSASDISGNIPATLSANDTYLDAALAADHYWWWVVAYSAGGVASDPGGPTDKNVP